MHGTSSLIFSVPGLDGVVSKQWKNILAGDECFAEINLIG
jgi:hypothetical protein